MYSKEQEILNLVKHFQNQTLPKEEWTHEAHLTVACWYLLNHTIDEATCFLRSGIITYNAAVGGKNTATGGYHETLTVFWIQIIAQFFKKEKGDLLTMVNQFLISDFADKTLPFQYYEKSFLMSTLCRARWMEPTLKNLES